MLLSSVISLNEINHTYLIIGIAALVAVILLKKVKKTVRIVLALVAAAALLAYFGGLAGLPIPLMTN